MQKFLDEIISIDELPLEPSEMYDVGMVDTPHTFFANNILVHNSCYFDMKPLVPQWQELLESELVAKIDEISDQLLIFINKTIGWLAKHHLNSDNNRLLFLKEKVIKRGFWGQAKKRYALLTIDAKTMEESIVIKGFDSVRSDFPAYFRKILEEIIIDILHDHTVNQLSAKVRAFKKEYFKQPTKSILVPNSVKELSKYGQGQKGSPINVKSAQNYNRLLNLWKLETYPPIEDGDKILYGYLTENPYGFDTMAISGYDDPPEILEFLEMYLDKPKIFESKLVGKVESIWEDLGFGKLELKTSNPIF